MKKYRWPAILMIIAILGITGFQLYWLKNNYDRERQNLEITTSASFRQTILRLQSSKLKLERLNVFAADSIDHPEVLVQARRANSKKFNRGDRKKEPAITMFNLMQERMKDSMLSGNFGRGAKGSVMIRTSDNIQRIADSAGLKDNVRTIVRSKLFDTTLFNPEQIRSVTVNGGKDPSKRFIAITVDKNILPDSSKTSRALNDIVRDHPPLLKEEVFEEKDRSRPRSNNQVFRFLYDIDSLAAKDSVTTAEVTKSFADRLKEDKIDVQFKVDRLDTSKTNLPNTVTVGFSRPAVFGLSLDNTFSYMFAKLKMPVLFSLLLVGITIFSFVLLYRNMIKQHRLAELKNEFISNITHELKTPIATVGVAIEALKNFNAIDDAERTKEYLDISQNELQRLNLLVDKVLKLAVFEKKEIELKKEWFDCRQLADEVMNSMKLQFEKCHAKVNLETEGDNFTIEADKLHITSVIYNLLDNALKYSKENPVITVRLKAKEQHIELSVEDNGIGIPAEYKGKVFDKFFRVPTGDKHNAKGYGLGLSYVSEVIKRHHGFITVDSEFGKGSIFTAYIPYKELPVIQFDEHRKVITKSIKTG